MDSSGLVGEVLKRRAYLLIFILSGFCGLIYESIWTHYLKLFLGHAAYAQTLVLAIFMGGMAVGSWLASRLTPRWSSPLLAYAIVEVLIGLMALVFHRVFVGLTDWSYDTVIPALDDPLAIELWKWGLAALLILPQSVLLGATFPFMSAGLARRFPRDPGRLIAGLYFANSLGAAAGILTSGFLLIAWVGLPGTIMTAGLLNILVALLVYVMVRLEARGAAPGAAAARTTPAHGQPALPAPVGALLLVSALTGLASFIYEIGWIRMLSLVLGSSTHAFELMLSAFILGLAIGGFWVRRHVDHFEDPLRSLAVIQVVMGALAIGTLAMYQQTFSAMSFAMQALQRTEQGYALFNLFSHGVALAVMLPATICAGMTLPIITWLLMTRGEGESAIGRVYAANTLGAIAGVVLAVQWLMPAFGLKWLLVIGGVVDIGLGIWLLVRRPATWRRGSTVTAAGALAFAVAVAVLVPLDVSSMASGVFMGRGLLTAEDKVVFHHDGRTATVDVVDHGQVLSIRTNGKVDAGLRKGDGTASEDESTMILSAAIPLMMHPRMRSAAVIGLGSGMSTDTLLAYPGLERVDTIEIEPGMVEGARHLGPKVARTFDDPRSVIHIADAKTFFTRNQRAFDLIVSEPSNPWVSGVAGLFSVEFYHRIAAHLNPGGLFAQWFNVYHADMPLVASIGLALGSVFPDYRVYATSAGDVLFVAGMQSLPGPALEAVERTAVQHSLQRVGVASSADLAWTAIGSARVLRPLFESYAVPANSDYFPFLDLHAVRARYLGANAAEIQRVATLGLDPVQEALWSGPGPSRDHPLRAARQAGLAQDLYQYWQALDADLRVQDARLPAREVANLLAVRSPLDDAQSCGVMPSPRIWLPALVSFASDTARYLPAQAVRAMLGPLRDSPCVATAPPETGAWLDLLLNASMLRDAEVIEAGSRLLPGSGHISAGAANELLVTLVVRAQVRLGRMEDALALFERYAHPGLPIELRALSAYAVSRATAH